MYVPLKLEVTDPSAWTGLMSCTFVKRSEPFALDGLYADVPRSLELARRSRLSPRLDGIKWLTDEDLECSSERSRNEG